MSETGIIRAATNWIKFRLFEPIYKAWQWLRFWGSVLRPCRFPVLMVVIGAVVLLLVPQGTDLLRGLAERVRLTNEKACIIGFFAAGALFWSFNAWYWSRVMLFLDFPGVPKDRSDDLHAFRTKAPRYIGFFAGMVIAAALFRASFGYDAADADARGTLRFYAAVAFAADFAFLAFMIYRRPWTLFVHDRLESVSLFRKQLTAPILGLLRVMPSSELLYGTMRIQDLRLGTKITASVTLIIAVVFFLVFVFSLQTAAPHIGAAAIVLYAAAGWIAVGSLIDIFGLSRRFPAISFLLVLAVLFSRWNDNHAVRTLETPNAASAAGQTITEELQAWYDHQNVRSNPSGTLPLFIVSAEGGGIRAAYWTASVLSRITDSNPCFPDQLFALSGVSGGSLGAAVYEALLANAPVTDDGYHCDRQGRRLSKESLLSAPTRSILSQNFLAPVMGAMLYPDLVQRLLPFPVERFDRARALEEAWEKAWTENQPDNISSRTTGSARFSEQFDNLWNVRDRRWMPALFLNSTWVETGKRLIASNVRLTPDDFIDAEDAREFYAKHPLRLSTAVHLSARFTYISPAGTLTKDGVVYGRAVDGGYFENSGETTVMEILKAIDQLAEENPAWKKVLPVVIHISNEPVDPDPRYRNIQLASESKDKSTRPQPCLNEVLSPPLTLLSTRNARGVYARESVKWYVGEENFLHFGLCKDRMAIPLGWVISEPVRQEMERQLEPGGCAVFRNADNLSSISNLLNKRYRTKTQRVQKSGIIENHNN